MMKKTRLVMTIILVCFSVLILLLSTANMPRGRVWRAERILRQDYEFLVIAAQFLADAPNERIIISRMDIERDEIDSRMDIKDAYVIEAFRKLANRRYNVITKDGNTITFQRWANRHMGWGIAFSIDGSVPARRSVTIVTLEPLSRPNWHFYVSR